MRAPEVERDLDLLFLGGSTPRRAATLASLGPLLWDRDVELRLFRFSAPVDGAAPGTVFGDDKYRLLARSRILLNLHRDDVAPGYFEWARMVEAMANGCAVLTEPSTGYEPLVDGKHFVVADDLAAPLAELLDDPRRCREIGEAARTAVLDEHPLVESLAPILDRLDDVAPGRPRRHRKPAPRGASSAAVRRAAPGDRVAPPCLRGVDGGAASAAPHRPHALHRGARNRRLRRALRNARLRRRSARR